MPAIIALLGRMLTWLVTTYIGQWVLKLLVTLGITVAVHQVAMPALMATIKGYAAGLPPVAYQAFGATGMDVFCSMVISALITATAGRMTLKKAMS